MKEIFLTERDKKILQYLYENKLSSVEQIQKKFFPSGAAKTAHNRLLCLKWAGYVKPQYFSKQERVRTAFHVSHKAYDLIVQTHPYEITSGRLQSDSFQHDLELVNIRESLERRRSVQSYLTETLLQGVPEFLKDEKIKPYVDCRVDAVIEVRAPNQKRYFLGVEYEASLKSETRCQKKLRNYYLQPELALVLFISKNKSIQDRMIKIDRELCQARDPKVYFSLLENVLFSSDKVVFENEKSSSIELK